MSFLLVAVGGGLGAILRYVIISTLEKRHKPFFYATFIVNSVGSFAVGIALFYSVNHPQWWFFLSTGLLGGLTTFSTFAFDLVRLYQEKNKKTLIIYSVCTLFVGMVAISLGYYLVS